MQPLGTTSTDTLFYDGHCALCHRFVRLALAKDRSGTAFRFAPLHGALFAELVPVGKRGNLPDSIVVLTAEGALLTRSAAALHVLSRLSGAWRLVAGTARLVPSPLRDAVYDAVARSRYRVFGTRDDACPVIPAESRSRFDLR